jgi:multidrug efflux system membrane fusion protein
MVTAFAPFLTDPLLTGVTVTPQHQNALFAGLLLFLPMLLVGCTVEGHPGGAAEAPKATVMHPEARDLTNSVEFNGWMQPDKIQEVRSRVRGHIKAVHFTDGQMVKKGDLLFEIDPRPFEEVLEAANAQVKAADAALELAQKEYARTRELVRTRAASREELDVWIAKQHVAAADKLKAEAGVRQANLDLEYSRITADIGGRIGKAELTEGNLVNAGGSDPLLTTIVSADPIRVYFNVDERSLQRYARSKNTEGKNVTELLAALKDAQADFTFALEGESDYKHTGRLAFSDNRIDPGTGTIQLYGTVPNKDGFFVPGARVHVRLPTSRKSTRALLVPETAILADQDKRYVLIADDKNVVKRRNVTLGMLTDDGMRVVEPADKLEEGEKPEDWWVLVDNLQRARLNYPIDPVKPGAAAPAES